MPLVINGRHGGQLLAGGVPGHKGGGGRPPDALRDYYRVLLSHPKAEAQFRKNLFDGDAKNWAAARKEAIAYAYGDAESFHQQDEQQEERIIKIVRPEEIPPWMQLEAQKKA